MSCVLALGGGAGLGWAHIGVLRAFEDAELDIVGIAGTSIGAIAGACAAAGKLDALEELARSANIRKILRYIDPQFRRGALIGGRTIERELQNHLGHLEFADLPYPIAAIAADLLTGDTVVLDQGPIVPAIRASMSLPGIFNPVRRGERLLVDGGAAMPVPVSAARALAPGRPCIAVSLQSDYVNRARANGVSGDGPPPSTVAVVKASVGLSLANLARYSLALDPPDILLSLPVGHIEIQNFTRAEELIAIGRTQAIAALPEIRAKLAALDPGAA